jgi:hypothetical protein
MTKQRRGSQGDVDGFNTGCTSKPGLHNDLPNSKTASRVFIVVLIVVACAIQFGVLAGRGPGDMPVQEGNVQLMRSTVVML